MKGYINRYAEDIAIVIPMYELLEYNDDYS